MTTNSTKSSASQSEAEIAVHLLDDWFDPIEVGLRDRVRVVRVRLDRKATSIVLLIVLGVR
jgi:hypothetical protein